MISTNEQRLARTVLLAGVAVWAASALIHWWLAVPLGHDEARYALDARDVLAGRPTRFIYAGGGITGIAIPGVLLGATERSLRLLPTLLFGGFFASVWYTARAAFGSTTAAWTVGVLAGGRGLALFGTELLSDLPSAMCLILAIGILVEELPRPGGPRWRLVFVGLLFDAAFYIRYGSCIPIAVITVVFGVVAWTKGSLRARPVIAAAAVAAVGLVPHVLWSVHVTGSLLGVIRASSKVPPSPTSHLGYFQSPLANYGLLVAPLALVGLLAVRRRWNVLSLHVIAVGQLVILTLTTVAQARYAFLATSLLVILGVDAVAQAARTRTVAAIVALALVVVSWGMVLRDTSRYRQLRINGGAYSMMAARAIAADRDPNVPCEVTSTDVTRLEWYSGCRGVLVFEQTGRQYLVRLGRDAIPSVNDHHVSYVPGMFDLIRLR